jgi:hypothetical protein
MRDLDAQASPELDPDPSFQIKGENRFSFDGTSLFAVRFNVRIRIPALLQCAVSLNTHLLQYTPVQWVLMDMK